jgi:outer membrane receptor protein involved in Fe transport
MTMIGDSLRAARDGANAMRNPVRISCFGLALFGGALLAQERETIVVSATRTENSLAEAPAAVTVITSRMIDRTPGDDFGDLLRNVPGLNVSQTSARDINMTARGSTNTLSNSQLVLLDGRSIYLDFFGIVLWDLLPVQASEIDQIEVVRGPGSAVWGANAMSGVTNVITRRPQDIVGTTLVVGTQWANVVHAAGDEDFAYKISAGVFDQPSYERPTGVVPGSNPPQTYPDFTNQGTTQRRAAMRFDWGMDGGYFSFGAGGAATDGIIHTGIGPFDIDDDTELNYVQADWYQGNAHIGASAQFLDGNATNLLTRSSNERPLGFKFVNDTYDIDVSNSNQIGDRQYLTYGGNVRTHRFDLDIAPRANRKNEVGAFVQDEIDLTDKWRWVIGVRYDDIDPLRDSVVTPRTSLLYSFTPDHTMRLSYNEAFRTPSAINSYLGISILQPLAPGVAAVADAFGDSSLTQEHLEAWEIGYVGYLRNGMALTAGAYRNETADSIDFYVANLFDPSNLPAPGPTLPAALVPCFAIAPGTNPACPLGGLTGVVPSAYSYRNIGSTVDKGIELSLDRELDDWYWWVNLSWQDDAEISDADPADFNRAPNWRANFGIGQEIDRFFWNATVNYQDEAYWADVLFARAPTDAFTEVNASVGWKFRDDSVTLKLIGQNLFDEKVQQHIFGDIIGRQLAAQISYTL